MKRLVGWLAFAFILLFVPNPVLAVEYTIENMYIEVQLEENGDAFVTETQTYHFDSSFNGVSRMLTSKEGSRVINFEAKEGNEHLHVEFEEGIYKIYREGDASETVTIKNSYTIKNAVEMYDDAAQFYWSFFDERNPSAYENFEIIIHPPAETSDVLSIGYDAARNKDQVLDGGSVHFDLGYVSNNTIGNFRTAFDKELFSGVEKIEAGSIKSEISSTIERRAKERAAFANRQQKLSDSAMIVLGAFGVILLALLLFAWQRKQATIMEIERKYTEPYFVPDEMMSLPATLSYTSGSRFIHTDALGVALLDLVRKGLVTESEDESFTVVHQNADYEHERHLMQWLFYKVGRNGVFHQDYLKEYANSKDNASTYQQDYHKWQRLVQDEVKGNHLFKNVLNFKIGLGVMAILLVGLVIQYVLHDLMLPMWGAIVLAISYTGFALTYRPLSAKGKKIKRDWDEFLQKYVTFEDKDWEELQSEEQQRAFLYSAGINNYQIKLKNEEFLNREPLTEYGQLDPMYYLLFAVTFNGHFDSAHTSSASASAPSSSSSTFTGGGGGIGGSGGGSGAF